MYDDEPLAMLLQRQLVALCNVSRKAHSPYLFREMLWRTLIFVHSSLSLTRDEHFTPYSLRRPAFEVFFNVVFAAHQICAFNSPLLKVFESDVSLMTPHIAKAKRDF